MLVAGTDKKAHQKVVQLGVRNSDLTQITTGINAGDPSLFPAAMPFRMARQSKSRSRRNGDKDSKDKSKRTAGEGQGLAGVHPCLHPASRSRRRRGSSGCRDLFIFFTIALALVGAYLAFSIPVSVFPSTDFPRIVIGVDNGVAPIDQMLVTITKPIEEAVNSVPGLQTVRSITSRGSAEVDLFFDWHSDMVLTLQRVDAVVAQLAGRTPADGKS